MRLDIATLHETTEKERNGHKMQTKKRRADAIFTSQPIAIRTDQRSSQYHICRLGMSVISTHPSLGFTLPICQTADANYEEMVMHGDVNS